MYKKYFDEYYVSNEELQEKIYKIVDKLIITSPQNYNEGLLRYVLPQQPAEVTLQNLINFVPAIKDIENTFDVLTITQKLTITAITLDMHLYGYKLEDILLKIIHMAFGSKFLAVRFMIAKEFIENKLNENLRHDGELILDNLLNSFALNSGKNKFISAMLAEEEIERVCESELTREEFLNLVYKFESSIESYIKKGLPSLIFESITRIFTESFLISGDLLDTSLNLQTHFMPEDKKEWKEMLLKMAREGTNQRLGRTHGGQRNRDGFSWTKERKSEFYQKVESIPKIIRKKDGKRESIYIWDHIYEQFDSRGFEAKELLQSESSYECIPVDLLNEAFSKWTKYEENYMNINTEDSPKMFLFKHALQALDFPMEYLNKRESQLIQYKRTTLQKHYDEGKRLVGDSDKQDVA